MKRARQLLFGFSTLGVLGGAPGSAFAASGPPIHLLLLDCTDVRESEVERVISAELATNVVLDDDAPDPTWIVGTCQNQRVMLEVTDAVSRKTVRRSFLLTGAAPEARSRLIGIAASELVLASWSELAQRPALRVEPEGTRPSAESARAARERARSAAAPAAAAAAKPTRASESAEDEHDDGDAASTDTEPRPARARSLFALQPTDQRRLRFMPMGSMRTFTNHPGQLYGAGLRVGEEPLVSTSWALDTLFETGEMETHSGRFQIETWTVGALLYLYGRFGIFTARAGAGLRAGYVSSRDQDGASRSAVLPWGWPMVALSLSFGRKGAQLELSGEAGYASLPVGAAASGLSIQGAWAAAQIGFGFAP